MRKPRKIRPYFRVPFGLLELIRECQLHDVELKTYLATVRHIQRMGEITAPLRCSEIARVTGCSLSATTRAMRRLVDLKMLYVLPGGKPHDPHGKIYSIPSHFLDLTVTHTYSKEPIRTYSRETASVENGAGGLWRKAEESNPDARECEHPPVFKTGR